MGEKADAKVVNEEDATAVVPSADETAPEACEPAAVGIPAPMAAGRFFFAVDAPRRGV